MAVRSGGVTHGVGMHHRTSYMLRICYLNHIFGALHVLFYFGVWTISGEAQGSLLVVFGGFCDVLVKPNEVSLWHHMYFNTFLTLSIRIEINAFNFPCPLSFTFLY